MIVYYVVRLGLQVDLEGAGHLAVAVGAGGVLPNNSLSALETEHGVAYHTVTNTHNLAQGIVAVENTQMQFTQ